jgi:hypothetical protein
MMVNKAKPAAKPALTDPVAAAVPATETTEAVRAEATGAGQYTPAPEQPPVTEPVVAVVAEPAVAKATKAKPPSKLVVIVKGPAKGRWRAGRHFTSEPVAIPLDDLTEDQQAALIADPELTVILNEA